MNKLNIPEPLPETVAVEDDTKMGYSFNAGKKKKSKKKAKSKK